MPSTKLFLFVSFYCSILELQTFDFAFWLDFMRRRSIFLLFINIVLILIVCKTDYMCMEVLISWCKVKQKQNKPKTNTINKKNTTIKQSTRTRTRSNNNNSNNKTENYRKTPLIRYFLPVKKTAIGGIFLILASSTLNQYI